MLPQEIQWDAAGVQYERAAPHEIVYRVRHALQYTTHYLTALEVVCLGYAALLDRVDAIVTQFKCERRSGLLWLVAQYQITQGMLYELGDEQNSDRSMHRLQKFLNQRGNERLFEREQVVDRLRKHQFEPLFPSEEIIVQQMRNTEEQLRVVMNPVGDEDSPD